MTMRTHIGPHRIYTSDWEFALSHRPKRTALGVLGAIVTILVMLAVGVTVLWLIANDPDALRSGLIAVGMLTLWLMAKGGRA